MNRLPKILLGGLGLWLSTAAATAEFPIRVLHADAVASYPTRIDFSVEAQSDIQIQTVELEYGVEGRDCTPDINIAIPKDFAPDTHIAVDWTLSVDDTGNLPPGLKIWWDWHMVDAQGNEARTEKQWILWIDSDHDWSSLRSGNIILHWYRGTHAYAQDLLGAAENARTILIQNVGAWPDLDINLYIYDSTQAMKDALVGEPDWIGGLSFWENQRTVMIGIGPGDQIFGKATIAHELAHVAVNSIMGGCYASIPLWLNEGIATYAEGTPDPVIAQLIHQAIYYNQFFSLRSISYEYQEIDGNPGLTYAESLSVVQFLVKEYGHEKIRRVLQSLGEGYTFDSALLLGLGLDMDGLEAVWRKSIGADPMPQKTPNPTPTYLSNATLSPFSSTPILSTRMPTSSLAPTIPPIPHRAGEGVGALLDFSTNLIAIACIGLFCLGLLILLACLLISSRRTSPPREG
jgi:hypothetical protein